LFVYFQDKATTKQGTIYGEIGSPVTLRLETGMSITEETEKWQKILFRFVCI
jgi:hypothetical protein